MPPKKISDPYFDQRPEGYADQLEFLKSNLQRHSESFRGGASYYRQQAFRFKMAALCLGAATTLLLGLKSSVIFSPYEPLLSAAALVLSALVPVLTAWDAFFDWRWLWVQDTSAYTALYALRDDLDFRISQKEPLTSDELKTFYRQLRAILDETNTAWRDKRSKAAEPSEK